MPIFEVLITLGVGFVAGTAFTLMVIGAADNLLNFYIKYSEFQDRRKLK